MNKLYIGTVVSTHGIKGEIRIISKLDESLKKKIFKIDNTLLIDDIEYKIKVIEDIKIMIWFCF